MWFVSVTGEMLTSFWFGYFLGQVEKELMELQGDLSKER